jgi:hypothetical protein
MAPDVVAEVLVLLPGERMELVDQAVDDEVPVREESVPLPQKLEGKIRVTPDPQLARVQIAASQLAILRLQGGKDIGLVLRLEHQKLLAVLRQDLHHQLLALLGIFGDVHMILPLYFSGSFSPQPGHTVISLRYVGLSFLASYQSTSSRR